MSLEQQKDILDHTFDLLTRFNNGIPPKGSVAPWWETSSEGTVLLLDKGIEYGMFCSFYSKTGSDCFRQTTLTWLMSASFLTCLLKSGSTNIRAPSCQAYYLRDEDTWTKIDYKAQAHTWMKPLQRGKETGLVEIPANWCQSTIPSKGLRLTTCQVLG